MGRGWADYHGSSPHTDHIHFSFTWNGAMGKTSWWTGVAATSYLTGPGTATGDPGSSTPITELKYGMENDYVKALQRALGGLPITGWFGPMTQGKVREYQQAHALSVTGVAEKVMLTQLGITLPGWSNGSGSGSGSAGDLRYGMESDAVKALQRALGGLPITGWFGPMTLARVKEYQGSHRLPVTGIADLATRTALGRVGGSTGQPTTCTPSAAALAAATASNATRYTAYLDVVLRTGCSGTAVRVLQAALGGVTVDGVYGPRTQAAVASYQSANGLLASGVADRPVWLALQRRGYPYLEYRLTVLRYGSEGAAVSALQRALGINPTGWFGPITEGKVKAFQKASSITQTGVVATLTWTALDRRDGR
jgi:peptidoglycan hydrolase-like protein with peptidoglycan-binding domain